MTIAAAAIRPVLPSPFPALSLKGGRSAAIELVSAVRHLLPRRLSAGAILALEDLVSWTRPSDWTSREREPVCYADASEVAKSRGVPPSTWRRYERALVDAGFIERRLPANGARSRWKGTGIYFGPLIRRIPELLALREKAEANRREAGFLRGQRSLHRRHLRLALEELRGEHASDHDIAALETALQAWPSADKLHRMPTEALRAHVAETDALCQKALDLLETVTDMPEPSGRPAKNERSYKQGTTQDLIVCPCEEESGQVSGSRSQAELPKAERDQQTELAERRTCGGRMADVDGLSVSLGPEQLYRLASPELRLYLDGRRSSEVLRFHDFLWAAQMRLRDLSIDPSVWVLAERLIGEGAAMLCLLITDAKRHDPDHPVYSPGGYLRGMVRAAERRELNLERSLLRLARKRGHADAL
jgi:replication initiation protein RepC